MNKLKAMIVGQKWLAEQLLAWCLTQPNIKVVAVSPPNEADRLARLATAHAYCFVEKEARDKANLGAVGYHPSLLPKYKGKNAVKLAFDNGDKVVGGSLYQLDDGWDAGQVLAQRFVAVDDNETLTSLWQEKLAPMGLELFKDYLNKSKL